MNTPRTATLAGSVHSWDVSTGVDGPGTRFVVFLAGCPLRCLYCQNPDTWRMRPAQRTPLSDLWRIAAGYTRFIAVAGGGLTVSGGEPLLQPAFTEALLRRAKAAGLHTALDTSGALGDRATDSLLDATDLVLLDIKSGDPATYRHVTGGGELAPTLRFARRLSDRGTRMWIRYVLVPGLTDDPANVAAVARFVATLSTVDRVEVLPFHRLGAAKYAALGLDFPLAGTPAPSPELVDRVRAQFRSHGLTVY